MKAILAWSYALFLGITSAGAATLSVSPTSVSAGGSVTATWSGIASPSTSNWLGMYRPGAADNAYLAWRNTTGTASGSVPFTIPASTQPGTYELRLWVGSSVTKSNTFFVPLPLSGTVTLGGAALAGVSFAATNGVSCTSSNASGQYTCGVPPAWSGSVTPSLSGYVFTPATRSYSNVTAAQTAQNYAATPTYQLSGTITSSGAPVAGVPFSASSGASCTASNASGAYACTVPQGWSGSVTTSLAGHSIAPVSRTYENVSASQSAQDFIATALYELSGTARVNGLPLPNVTLTATNGVTCTSSNASGQYACVIPAGWSGTLTPSASGYSFTPTSRSFASVAGPQLAQDFAATLVSATAPMFFVHVDHLNTPRLVADAAGTPVWKWDQQEPFGNNVADENPGGLGAFDLPLRLPGQYFDRETNLHYNMARNYWPDGGRYVEADPLGIATTWPRVPTTGLNHVYSYVNADPLTHVDPLGLQPWAGPLLNSLGLKWDERRLERGAEHERTQMYNQATRDYESCIDSCARQEWYKQFTCEDECTRKYKRRLENICFGQ